MLMTQSIAYNFYSTNRTAPFPRLQTFFSNPISYKSPFLTNRSSQYSTWQNNSKLMKRNIKVYSSIPPEVPPITSGGLPGGLPGSWKSWLLGMAVTVIIPLLTNKWGALLKWSEKVETTIQTVEDIVEGVEEVAEKVEKLTEDFMDDLPEGKLKTALGRIEHVAEKVAKDAKQIDTVIDKVQEVEDKLQAYIEEEEQRAAVAKKDKDGKKIIKTETE